MKWISVEDRLPSNGIGSAKAVIVGDINSNNYGKYIVGWYWVEGGWMNENRKIPNVTHWMPLPEPPRDTPR